MARTTTPDQENETPESPEPSSPWQPILAEARLALPSALLAGVLALLATFALRLAFSLPLLAELLGDAVTRLIPLPLFSLLLNIFGTNAKHLFAGTLIGLGVLYLAALGALYSGVRRYWLANHPSAPPTEDTRRSLVDPNTLGVLDAGILVVWTLVPTALISLILLRGDFPSALGSVLALTLTFAPSFVLLSQGPRREPVVRPEDPTGRRRLIRNVGFAVLVVAAGAATWELLAGQLGALLGGTGSATLPNLSPGDVPARIVPPPTPNYTLTTPVSGQTAEVTAASDFYYVSKNLVSDPSINAASWKLTIHGLVDRPYTLTYDQLKALPSEEQYHTLECISNEVGGDLMSNALFRGVKVADVLNAAGIKQGATEMIFRAADGYSDEWHLAQALDPRALIVYLINGEALPQAHGFPARLLIPNLYGMKNGKWLTDLELGPGGYNGYWEDNGWNREAVVKMMSRIDTPREGDVFNTGRATTIAGVAYAGARGISQVQVTTDGGRTWQVASLRRPLGALTWTLWAIPWTPSTTGELAIACRSVDLDGNLQQPQTAPPLPDGSSGYHIVNVIVK